MHTSTARIYAATASVALAALTGCAGGSSQMTPPAIVHPTGHPKMTRSFFRPDAKVKPLIFVSDQSGYVNIYQQGDKKLVGQIFNLTAPQGMATDTAGNLYVTNGYFTSTETIEVYAPPYTGAPTLTLDDGGSSTNPNSVAVSLLGVVAVANGNGSVVFYAKNSTTSCATISDPTKLGAAAFDSFDDKGNLYVAGYSGSASVVVKLDGGCKANGMTLLTTTNTLSFARGIQVDKADRIAILDDGSPQVVYTYDPPKNGSLGSPISTAILKLISRRTNFFALAFLASGRDFYTVNYNDVASEYDHPAGGKPDAVINLGGIGPGGVAVTPPLVP